MKPAAVTDTHSLLWFLEDSPRLGREAGRFFDDCVRGEGVIYIPTICLREASRYTALHSAKAYDYERTGEGNHGVYGPGRRVWNSVTGLWQTAEMV